MSELKENLIQYHMMTSSNGNIFRVTGHLCGEFTDHRWIPLTQRPVTQSFDIFFDLRLNKRLSKQSSGWWFETPSCSLWSHCNEWIQDNHGKGRPHTKITTNTCYRKLSITRGILSPKSSDKPPNRSPVRAMHGVSEFIPLTKSLQWRHNERNGVSNHLRFECLLSRLFRRKLKKISTLCITALREGNPPVTGWIPLTKGQWRRKCFHLMTSSWLCPITCIRLRYIIHPNLMDKTCRCCCGYF